MDKMRKEFEEWVNSFLDDEKDALGLYDAWQASRKALVVELPNELDLYPRRILRADIIKVLDAAGVAYK